MGRVEKTVFVSYRRTNFPWALAIFQDLTQHGFDVFFDFTGIASGDFESAILGNIKARAHFVVLLTPSALERCSEPGDWLRREIETALEFKRNIVPLMLESFDFGALGIGDQLTGDLEALKGYNGLRIVPEYFEEGLTRLRDKYLNIALDAVLHPASLSAKKAAKVQQAAAASAPPVQEEQLTATEWYERGYNATDLDEELRCYSEAIRLKPDYADAFCARGNARGTARSNKGDLDGAIQDFNEAIRLNPDLVDAYYDRGIARHDKGNLEEAIQDYDKAIQLRPFAEAFHRRGVARSKKGDLDGAIQDYDKAIQLKPDSPSEVFINRGISRSEKGDLDGAIQDYSEAIRLKPDHANAFYNRGYAHRQMGDRKNAIVDYQKYLDLGGGARYGDQEEIEKRIRDLKKSLASDSPKG